MSECSDEEARVFAADNWDKFPILKARGEKIFDSIKERVSDLAQCKCTWFPGSCSFIVNGKTVGKLAPEGPDNPRLMMGFSVTSPNAHAYADHLGRGRAELCYYRTSPEEYFWMCSVDPDSENGDTMVAFLKDASS